MLSTGYTVRLAIVARVALPCASVPEPSDSFVRGYRGRQCTSVWRRGGGGGCSTGARLSGWCCRPRRRPSVAGCQGRTLLSTARGRRVALQ